MKTRNILMCNTMLAALALSGCGASVPVKVGQQSLSGIRTVAIVKVPEPREYTVIDKGSPAGAMGAVGGAAIAMEANKNQKGLLGALARTKFSFADELTAELQATLRKLGYQTKVVSAQRSDPHKLLGEYSALTTSNDDAVLDVSTKGAGYATQHWLTSPFWRPEAHVEVALYSRNAGELVYDESFMYGYHNPFISATNLDAPVAYQFANKAAMEATSDERLISGLKDAAKAIANAVAAKFAK